MSRGIQIGDLVKITWPGRYSSPNVYGKHGRIIGWSGIDCWYVALDSGNESFHEDYLLVLQKANAVTITDV